jgi:hypothetical protein
MRGLIADMRGLIAVLLLAAGCGELDSHHYDVKDLGNGMYSITGNSRYILQQAEEFCTQMGGHAFFGNLVSQPFIFRCSPWTGEHSSN